LPIKLAAHGDRQFVDLDVSSATLANRGSPSRRGSGQPVVFSHGWPLNADAWESQTVFLASHGYRPLTLLRTICTLDVHAAFVAFGHHSHPPWIAADFAVLDEGT
jgi:pimeloyl-ACP methyl ester carboxylesterase